jgi:tetratricopeptide (TPR) repeat protein
MILSRYGAGVAALVLAVLICGPAVGSAFALQQQQQTPYTRAEYDAYQAAANEQDAQKRVRLLDEFVSKFPQSTLLPYVYRLYYLTYSQLQNHAKVIEYADKLLTADNLDIASKLEALVARAQSFYLAYASQQMNSDTAVRQARDAARQGLQVLEQWPKPEQMTQEQYEQQRRSLRILMNTVAGMAELHLKNYAAAEPYLRAALELDPNDALNHYRLSLAYLQQQPPRHIDGFWELARAISLKPPNEAQLRSYLRNQLLLYQRTACQELLDQQMNELLVLAGAGGNRPPDYRIPSADELEQVRAQSTNIVADLKADGEKAKNLFLATCGLEFPLVVAKAFEVAEGNGSVVIKAYTSTETEAEAMQNDLEAATEPNIEIHVTGQPEAARLSKDDYFRFSGTLTGYQPEPFLLRFRDCKVNPEDIPAVRGQPTKRGKRP